jgi:hypothetical protein
MHVTSHSFPTYGELSIVTRKNGFMSCSVPIDFNLSCVPDQPGTFILRFMHLVTIYLSVDYFTMLSIARLHTSRTEWWVTDGRRCGGLIEALSRNVLGETEKATKISFKLFRVPAEIQP